MDYYRRGYYHSESEPRMNALIFSSPRKARAFHQCISKEIANLILLNSYDPYIGGEELIMEIKLSNRQFDPQWTELNPLNVIQIIESLYKEQNPNSHYQVIYMTIDGDPKYLTYIDLADNNIFLTFPSPDDICTKLPKYINDISKIFNPILLTYPKYERRMKINRGNTIIISHHVDGERLININLTFSSPESAEKYISCLVE